MIFLFPVAGFDLDLHEDHYDEDDTFDDRTLKKPMSIEQRIRKESEVEPSVLNRCSFKLEINEKAIYDLSQEEAVELIKSFESDPVLKR